MNSWRFASNCIVLALLSLLFSISQSLGEAGSSYENRGQEKLDKGEYPRNPDEVVKAYCSADLRGDGWSSDSWKNLHQYTLWEDAPGWDTAVIISSFDAHSIRTNSEKSDVRVVYRILGRQSGDDFTEKRYSETRIYHLQKQNGRWKIREPQLPPHISTGTAINHLEKLRSNPENGERLANINKSINLLKKLESVSHRSSS